MLVVIYDCVYRFFSLFVYFVILINDRSVSGHSGYDIDRWIDINMIILVFEFSLRCIAIQRVSSENTKLFKIIDSTMQTLMIPFNAWGLQLIIFDAVKLSEKI